MDPNNPIENTRNVPEYDDDDDFLTEEEQVEFKKLLERLTPERLKFLAENYPPPDDFWTNDKYD